ncbi:hypothetical protein [Cupriavidus malaysiensis]|uniref:Uncharacterized protein n=1 Tax=Cupriavidus malaysiensis TaxID=367825 RepID=A0ABM6FGJ8_9BURK|nr:hypothetical protein [Cupriavidus malaysiensis]AOZ11084.1 hypothetical protein BKK80_34555 [Cupriavidus malaysiensis]
MLFASKSSGDLRRAALAFFFGKPAHGKVSFDLACAALQARPDVVRLRIQYELYLRMMKMSGPFPFATIGIPPIIEGEIIFHAGFAGHALARETWAQPGISQGDLLTVVKELDGFNQEVLLEALSKLHEQRLIASIGSVEVFWYLTGRNPLENRMHRPSRFGREVAVGGTASWSQLFGHGHG